MVFLALARWRITRDRLVAAATPREFRAEKLQPVFWIYAAFTFFSTLGFVNFGLVGYRLKARSLMSDANITLLYAGAMATDAVTARLVGKAYDRMKRRTGVKTGGLGVLLLVRFLTLALPFLVLAGSTALVVVGMVLFGIVVGAHETVMRSAIADITPFSKRGTATASSTRATGSPSWRDPG